MPSNPAAHRFSHKAMATVFEVFVYGEQSNDALQAARAAFDELDALEQKLSYFIPSSEISQINRLRPGEAALISGAAMQCLQIARTVFDATAGAFDPTAGSLLEDRRPWDEHEDLPRGSVPPPRTGQVSVGMELFDLKAGNRTVTALAEGARIDLGAIGKGFAADAMARVLEDWGVGVAMIVAGQSTMLPLGARERHDGWLMRIRDPRNEKAVVQRVRINGAALSTSGVVGDAHILDPMTGDPVRRALGAWAVAPTAAESDALSTAFMVMPADAVREYCDRRTGVAALVFTAEGQWVEAGEWPALVAREGVEDSASASAWPGGDAKANGAGIPETSGQSRTAE